MTRKNIRLAVLGAVAAVAVVGAQIAPSWAYFTAHSRADGGMPVEVIPQTDITENWDNNTKHIVITNNEDSETAVFVRAKVFANPKYLAAGSPSGTGWTYNASDGYWYYTAGIVEPGGATDALDVKVEWPSETVGPDGEVTPIDHTGENFNIIVVYEATPAQYKDGQLVDPMSSDCNWDLKATE